MEILLTSCAEAFRLLFSGDPDTWEIVAISFRVSTLAILCAVPPALLIAFALAYGNFIGRRLLISVFNTFLSVPAVVIGFLAYGMGPLCGASFLGKPLRFMLTDLLDATVSGGLNAAVLALLWPAG